MALLNGVSMVLSCYSNHNNGEMSVGEFGNEHGFLNMKCDNKWGCIGLLVDDGNSSMAPPAGSCGSGAGAYAQESKIIKLPKPLTAAGRSPFKDGLGVRVAYQGVAGAYSEAATLKAYPKCETVPCDQFESAFKAVELWIVDKAVLPIENSVGGSIHRNYELLLRHRLHIVGEVKLAVNHCLLGLPGVRTEELKRVLSHPLALSQCEMNLNMYGLARVAADDTAGAAQIVASQGVKETGAVASARAAELYGLDILASKIQDNPDNITRFIILSRNPIIPGTHTPHKIESRPQLKRPLRVVDDSNNGSSMYFDYLFYIDFEASMVETRAQYALRHLQEFSRFVRILGSYPMDLST